MSKTKTKAAHLGRSKLPKIKIIGIGGGGSSIVGEIAKIFSREKFSFGNRLEFIVVNVDTQALKAAPKQTKKFYFGEEVTYGLGCGMNPELGEKAAVLAKEKIKKELSQADLCIFISSLGGGTGSGATPVFTQIADSLKVLSLGIFTLPFKFEGIRKQEIAKEAIKKIKPNLNAITVISNQKIFQIIDQKTSLRKAFSSMNKILIQALEGLIDSIYSPGTINIDFADLRTILKTKGEAAFLGCGTASGQNRAEKALEKLIKNPLFDYKFENAQNFLFNIAGSKNIKMKEVEEVSRTIFKFNPKAKIIFGISQEPKLKNQLKITLLAIGCQKETKVKKAKEKKEEEKKEKKTKGKPKKVKTTKLKKPRKTVKISQKTRIRRNALDLHKMAKESEKELLEEEKKWDIPAFLRKKASNQ
jgi:cell division protein FtsZ